jgi:purine nucleosidase
VTTAVDRIKMVIDTDGGVDDAVAILWAATSPRVDLLGISVVHGNVAMLQAGLNVCRILELAGRTDVPVALGEAHPYPSAPHLRPADFVHGADGLGNTNYPEPSLTPTDEHGVDMLLRLVAENAGNISLVTIGPLTNVARAIARDASFASRVRDLVVMGGAVTVAGNALPAAEANIAHDPEAAAEVVRGSWSSPPLLVGLDVTHLATFTPEMLESIEASSNPYASYLATPLRFYSDAGGTFCAPGEFPCHDLLAVLASCMPVIDADVLPLAVQHTAGPALGATIADLRVPFFARKGPQSIQSEDMGFSDWRIGLRVDVELFRREIRALFAL